MNLINFNFQLELGNNCRKGRPLDAQIPGSRLERYIIGLYSLPCGNQFPAKATRMMFCNTLITLKSQKGIVVIDNTLLTLTTHVFPAAGNHERKTNSLHLCITQKRAKFSNTLHAV